MTDMVTRVAEALEKVQLFSRWNDWTSDRVEGMPIEICRYGVPETDEVIIVRRFDASWKEEDALRLCIKEALARAAIEAIRAPTSMEWLPIETAPRDGTKVFIREGSGRVQVAMWRSSWGAKPDWYVQLTGGNGDDYPTTDVRYWMPIPDVEERSELPNDN